MSYLNRLFVDALCPRSEHFFQLRLPDGRQISSSRDLIVGRKQDNYPKRDILELFSNFISREHALFQIESNSIVVTDTFSRNGTFVGNQLISDPRVLIPGDVVTLAGRLTYQDRAWKVVDGYPIKFLGSYF